MSLLILKVQNSSRLVDDTYEVIFLLLSWLIRIRKLKLMFVPSISISLEMKLTPTIILQFMDFLCLQTFKHMKLWLNLNQLAVLMKPTWKTQKETQTPTNTHNSSRGWPLCTLSTILKMISDRCDYLRSGRPFCMRKKF